VEYLVLCSRAPGNELVAAECEALIGGKPGLDGLAVCTTVDRVAQAAYLSMGVQLIAYGETFHSLVAETTRQDMCVERFRIEYISLSVQTFTHSQDAILAIANAIDGAPDLTHPNHRFLIIATDNGFYLTRIVVEAEHTYQKHDNKPYRTSSSLPSQLARALVNLAYPARTILDPCCGTGSILLEACATGVTAFGIDRNPKMVGMTRRNLQYFGYDAMVHRGSADDCTQTVDAVVTDLPYGRFLEKDEDNIKAILQQVAGLAPVGVYLTEQDISTWLQEAGYQKVDVYRVRKRAGMTRYIHRAKIYDYYEPHSIE
jgi:tRNA G10  N-methylase Trm11